MLLVSEMTTTRARFLLAALLLTITAGLVLPDRILLANPIEQPVFVMAARGHTLTIVNVTLTGLDGAVLAVLPTLNSSNDTTQRFLEPHYAIIMPDKPMLPMTTYKVVINGKDNSTPFTRQFSFTTGNGA